MQTGLDLSGHGRRKHGQMPADRISARHAVRAAHLFGHVRRQHGLLVGSLQGRHGSALRPAKEHLLRNLHGMWKMLVMTLPGRPVGSLRMAVLWRAQRSVTFCSSAAYLLSDGLLEDRASHFGIILLIGASRQTLH